VPKQKVDVAQLIKILRDDNDVKAQIKQNPDIPEGSCNICQGITRTSFVAQLRSDMPADVGLVYWMCLAQPRTSIYIPYYYGISDFPAGFRAESKQPSNRTFSKKTISKFTPNPFQAFWTFSNFQQKVADADPETITRIQNMAKEIEQSAFDAQSALEQAAMAINEAQRAKLLTNYSKGFYLSSLETMDKALAK
jgi:dipeptidase